MSRIWTSARWSQFSPFPTTCRIAETSLREDVRDEMNALLRYRLRSAASVLFIGFAAFLVKNLLDGHYVESANTWLLVLHVFVLCALLVATLMLCGRHSQTRARLRFWELVIFGLPAVFFTRMQFQMGCIQSGAGSESAVEAFVAQTIIPWVTLIYLYGMFIPNHWRRAAIVLSGLSSMPILVVLSTAWQCPVARQYIFDDTILSFLLWVEIPTFAAIFGAHNLGTLRREAAAAKELGSYRLVRKLGSGGMGDVFLAEHRMLKRPCAIKLIRPSQAQDPQALARFEAEVRATARLTHWNSVEIYDYGHTDDGTFYYAMEYLPGLNLQEMVDTTGPLPPERAVHLLAQVCAALKEAHAIGMVHRDIKPGNVIVTERGGVHDVAKLLDFGLVKCLGPKTTSVKLTMDGAVVGSPLYLAPEIGLGEGQPDVRSDIYSLGAMLYFLLTGRPVFDHDKPMKVIFAHVHDAVPPPSRMRAGLPADLDAIVLRCLAKDPASRFQDVASLEVALASTSAAGEWTARQAEEWWTSYERRGLGRSERPAPESDETVLLEVHQ